MRVFRVVWTVGPATGPIPRRSTRYVEYPTRDEAEAHARIIAISPGVVDCLILEVEVERPRGASRRTAWERLRR